MKAIYEVAAPAKLNLFLHVIGRRSDGYHLLQSVFALIDWSDTLHFECRADGTLMRHDLASPLPVDDLVLRAARALQHESGCRLGADISIEKHLPVGAGLGGGSSDAASTLLALNRLWRLRWPRRRLAALGLTLGADVPFFIGASNAFVEGIGEAVTPIAVPRQWYAVVKPAAGLETRAVFGHAELRRDTAAVILAGFLAEAATAPEHPLTTGYGRNDLQPPAQSACPEVAAVAGWLQRRFGNSRMTGSGSAVYARAGTGDQPVATLQAGELPAGWVGRMCRGLAQHPLAGWAAD
jgi:4-diphosphocytidyl-2-C-methyl-D-erythritol kinase